jgi:Tfp pilus assembly protein PilX
VPTWLLIILIVLALLAIGGAIAARRRLAATSDRFDANLQHVNRDLAAARAEDRGWERDALEQAARDAFAAERGGAAPADLELVQVVDRPGTDEDKAVFRVGRERLTLGRRDGQWVLETLE